MFDFFGVSFGTIIIYLFSNLLVFFVLFRKKLISTLEPLSLFIISQSFTITLSFMTINNNEYILQIITSHLIFYIGFIISTSSRKIKLETGHVTHENYIYDNNVNMKIFEVCIMILFLLTLFSNIYQFNITGIALFDIVPTAAKVSNYTDGLGIVRRINWGAGVFSSIGLLLLYFKKTKKIYLFLLIISIIISILGGSKSSLLQYLFIYTAIATQLGLRYKVNLKKYKKTILFLSIMSIFVVLLILNKDSGNSENPFVSLFRRLLYYGDIVLYYYDSTIYSIVNQKNTWEYFLHIINPITGFLRINIYEFPLGYEMVLYSLNRTGQQLESIVGPNTPFFVKGNIFFGLLGGFLYSFIIGWLIGMIRKMFLKNKSKNIFTHSMKIWLFVNCFALATEDTLFISMIWDLLIVLLPTLVISIIVVKSLVK